MKITCRLILYSKGMYTAGALEGSGTVVEDDQSMLTMKCRIAIAYLCTEPARGFHKTHLRKATKSPGKPSVPTSMALRGVNLLGKAHVKCPKVQYAPSLH